MGATKSHVRRRLRRLKVLRTVRSSEIKARRTRTWDQSLPKDTSCARAVMASSSSLPDSEKTHVGQIVVGTDIGGSASSQQAPGASRPSDT